MSSDAEAEGAGPVRDDPGWPPPSPRAVLAALVPGLLGRYADDPSVPAVTVLRRIFVGFLAALVVIGATILVVVDPLAPVTGDGRVWALLVVGAVSSLAGTQAAARRPIVCATPARLARQVGAATFLGLATANTSALTGFVAAYLADGLWPYLIGLAPTVIGLLRVAPTRRRVRELDRHLALVGCSLTAGQILYAQPGDPTHPSHAEDATGTG